MSELGQLLKQKRLEQGISMEKLQEETKIRKRYIEAIEQGDLNILPGQFYARAFIKSYAEAVGLNPEALLEEYKHELPVLPTGPIEPVPSRKTKNIKTRSPKIGKWASRLLFYAFFLVLLFVVWLGAVRFFGGDGQTLDPARNQGPGIDGTIDSGGESDNSNTDSHGSEEPVLPEQPMDEPDEPEQEPVWSYVGTEGSTSTYRYEHGQQQEVTVRATRGNIWMEIKDEDTGASIASNATVPDQGELTWDLQEHAKVNFHFGNTASVELLINGEVMDLSEIPNRGRSIRLIIDFGSELSGQ